MEFLQRLPEISNNDDFLNDPIYLAQLYNKYRMDHQNEINNLKESKEEIDEMIDAMNARYDKTISSTFSKIKDLVGKYYIIQEDSKSDPEIINVLDIDLEKGTTSILSFKNDYREVVPYARKGILISTKKNIPLEDVFYKYRLCEIDSDQYIDFIQTIVHSSDYAQTCGRETKYNFV